MQAYGKMLEGHRRASTSRQGEHLRGRGSPVPARRASRTPSTSTRGAGSSRTRERGGDRRRPDFQGSLEMQEKRRALTEENEERGRARRANQDARQRQQLLAQMVAHGHQPHHRHHGEIKASGSFDMKSQGHARSAHAGGRIRLPNATEATDAGIGGWFSGGDETGPPPSPRRTRREQEKSESVLENQGQALRQWLTGSSKSETFPLERLASADERGGVQQKSAR